MERIAFPNPSRPGSLCEPSPGGGYHGWPSDSRPTIKWNHIDGPMLRFRNGEIHWLTWQERFRCWMGWEDALSLERKHRPHLAKAAEKYNYYKDNPEQCRHSEYFKKGDVATCCWCETTWPLPSATSRHEQDDRND